VTSSVGLGLASGCFSTAGAAFVLLRQFSLCRGRNPPKLTSTADLIATGITYNFGSTPRAALLSTSVVTRSRVVPFLDCIHVSYRRDIRPR